jgi:hypothetical protein
MSEQWGVCEEPCIILDVSHWQGTDIDFPACKALGVRGVIVKRYHGSGYVKAYDEQFPSAQLAGIELLGDYAWLVPTSVPVDLQVAAWATPAKGRLPFTIDWEDPSTKLRGKPLVSILERAIEIKSDKDGRRPTIYTGAWYWRDFCQGVDSEIVAACDLHLAAYPRKTNTGLRYTEAQQEVCGGHMPGVPLPWAKRGLQPLIWQFSGDAQPLRLPPSKNGASPAVDVNTGDARRLFATIDAPPDTLPEGETGRRRSSQRVKAFSDAATLLRAPEGEHTPIVLESEKE